MSNTTSIVICEDGCFGDIDVSKAKGNIVTCEYCGKQHVLSKEVRQAKAEYTAEFRVILLDAFRAEFSKEEMVDLIIAVNGLVSTSKQCDYENLPAGKNGLIREYVLFAERHACLQEVVDVAISLRPYIDLGE